MKVDNQVQILDCSIRDGGYINNWQFSREMVRESYRALSKSGVDFVELGFRSSEKYFDRSQYGLWRFSDEEFLQESCWNINGSRVAVMGDFGKIDLEDLSEKKDSCIDLVRVAVHKNKVFDAIDLLEKIKSKGYLVSLQCMAYSSYTDYEKNQLLKALAGTNLDYVYVGDSYGSVFPFQIQELFEPFLELDTCKVGFHPHNNIQMSFANTLEAIRIGVDIVDTTIYGIGRGAGNLPTEILLAYYIAKGDPAYNVIPILDCIEHYYLDVMQETPWGYQLPYMISGIFESHPSYSKELLSRKEYSMADIWRSLGYIDEVKPLGFDKGIIDNLIQKGFIGNLEGLDKKIYSVSGEIDETGSENLPDVQYINRHQDREFLVLANGPTLKSHKKEIDRFIETYDPVVLGANFLDDLYKPDYHAFNNASRLEFYVSTVNPSSQLLLGTNLSEDLIDKVCRRQYEKLAFVNDIKADFGITDGVILSSCRTISVLLIGVAVVMGAKRVFVAGLDGYVGKDSVKSTLFYDEEFDLEEHDRRIERHRRNEKFLMQIDAYIKQHGGEGIHVLTPTNHATYYKGITNYIDNL